MTDSRTTPLQESGLVHQPQQHCCPHDLYIVNITITVTLYEEEETVTKIITVASLAATTHLH